MTQAYIKSHKRQRPREGGVGIGKSLTGHTDSISKLSFPNTPLSSTYRQPDTLMSLCGRNGPAYQETNVELLAKKGPYRALSASLMKARRGIKGEPSIPGISGRKGGN